MIYTYMPHSGIKSVIISFFRVISVLFYFPAHFKYIFLH